MIKYLIKKDDNKEVVLRKSGKYVVELMGKGAEVRIRGRFNLIKKQKLDLEVIVVHRVANTSANTDIRAVVRGKAEANIGGKIIVNKGAQNTNSFLTEKVLLVSPGARAVAVPDLEIEANEVKCSHAATVGKIDEEQIFYLTSRGITKKTAKKMIIKGFLKGVEK